MYSETQNADAMRLRLLAAGLADQKVCVVRQNASNVCDFAENLPTAWPVSAMVGFDDTILPEDMARCIADVRTRAHASGKAETAECESLYQRQRHIFEVRANADTADDTIVGTVLVITDVTDRHERDQVVANLMREVSHRTKNLLAVVQSIAVQTAHHSDTISDFLRKFRGRLHAISGSQDLITESDWRGGQLHALIHEQLQRLGQGPDSVEIHGENPLLGPNAATHLGLALHELATNAALYGALSESGRGRIVISIDVEYFEGLPRALTLDWRETHSSQQTPTAPRFGTMLLERIVPLSVGGSASFEVTPHAVRYTLSVPADQFEA